MMMITIMKMMMVTTIMDNDRENDDHIAYQRCFN